MKKVFGLLVFLFLLNGCNDGDVTVDTVDFTGVDPQLCSENASVMYKINVNKTETFVLIIPSTLNPYPNIVGTATFAIGNIAQVIYRRYNGTITSSNICATIQPGNPSLAEEWIATSGTVVITTAPVYSTADPITGATTILKYRHHIVFTNIVFAKPNDTNQVYETMDFGYYLGSTVSSPPFDFEDELQQCSTNNIIYKINEFSGLESLTINNIEPSLINSTLGGPKIGYVGTETNALIYQSYKTDLPVDPANYFCTATTPTEPEVSDTWTGVAGSESAQTGIIEVYTEENTAGGLTHTITLKKVTFYNAATNSSFYYGHSILYGKLRTAD